MKTLVIPDIHQRLARLEAILKTPADTRIFLGDWFDDYDAPPEDTRSTLTKLQELQQDPNNIFIFGNHDMHYLFPLCRGLRCSGWTPEKQRIIGPFAEELRKKFVLMYYCEGFTLSHAGFTYNSDNLAQDCEEALEAVIYTPESLPALLSAGACRGGYKIGGCTWLDWEYEFKPVKGLKQIVGHTFAKQSRQKSDNWCIDTALRHYGIIEDGKFSVHNSGE